MGCIVSRRFVLNELQSSTESDAASDAYVKRAREILEEATFRPAVAVTLLKELTASPRRKCKYGAKCYRKNPEHREEFCHPGEAGWDPPAPITNNISAEPFLSVRKRLCNILEATFEACRPDRDLVWEGESSDPQLGVLLLSPDLSSLEPTPPGAIEPDGEQEAGAPVDDPPRADSIVVVGEFKVFADMFTDVAIPSIALRKRVATLVLYDLAHDIGLLNGCDRTPERIKKAAKQAATRHLSWAHQHGSEEACVYGISVAYGCEAEDSAEFQEVSALYRAGRKLADYWKPAALAHIFVGRSARDLSLRGACRMAWLELEALMLQRTDETTENIDVGRLGRLIRTIGDVNAPVVKQCLTDFMVASIRSTKYEAPICEAHANRFLLATKVDRVALSELRLAVSLVALHDLAIRSTLFLEAVDEVVRFYFDWASMVGSEASLYYALFVYSCTATGQTRPTVVTEALALYQTISGLPDYWDLVSIFRCWDQVFEALPLLERLGVDATIAPAHVAEALQAITAKTGDTAFLVGAITQALSLQPIFPSQESGHLSTWEVPGLKWLHFASEAKVRDDASVRVAAAARASRLLAWALEQSGEHAETCFRCAFASARELSDENLPELELLACALRRHRRLPEWWDIQAEAKNWAADGSPMWTFLSRIAMGDSSIFLDSEIDPTLQHSVAAQFLDMCRFHFGKLPRSFADECASREDHFAMLTGLETTLRNPWWTPAFSSLKEHDPFAIDGFVSAARDAAIRYLHCVIDDADHMDVDHVEFGLLVADIFNLMSKLFPSGDFLSSPDEEDKEEEEKEEKEDGDRGGFSSSFETACKLYLKKRELPMDWDISSSLKDFGNANSRVAWKSVEELMIRCGTRPIEIDGMGLRAVCANHPMCVPRAATYFVCYNIRRASSIGEVECVAIRDRLLVDNSDDAHQSQPLAVWLALGCSLAECCEDSSEHIVRLRTTGFEALKAYVAPMMEDRLLFLHVLGLALHFFDFVAVFDAFHDLIVEHCALQKLPGWFVDVIAKHAWNMRAQLLYVEECLAADASTLSIISIAERLQHEDFGASAHDLLNSIALCCAAAEPASTQVQAFIATLLSENGPSAEALRRSVFAVSILDEGQVLGLSCCNDEDFSRSVAARHLAWALSTGQQGYGMLYALLAHHYLGCQPHEDSPYGVDANLVEAYASCCFTDFVCMLRTQGVLDTVAAEKSLIVFRGKGGTLDGKPAVGDVLFVDSPRHQGKICKVVNIIDDGFGFEGCVVNSLTSNEKSFFVERDSLYECVLAPCAEGIANTALKRAILTVPSQDDKEQADFDLQFSHHEDYELRSVVRLVALWDLANGLSLLRCCEDYESVSASLRRSHSRLTEACEELDGMSLRGAAVSTSRRLLANAVASRHLNVLQRSLFAATCIGLPPEEFASASAAYISIRALPDYWDVIAMASSYENPSAQKLWMRAEEFLVGIADGLKEIDDENLMAFLEEAHADEKNSEPWLALKRASSAKTNLPPYWTIAGHRGTVDQMITISRTDAAGKITDIYNEVQLMLDGTWKDIATRDRPCPKKMNKCAPAPGGCKCVRKDGHPGMPEGLIVKRILRVEDTEIWKRYCERRCQLEEKCKSRTDLTQIEAKTGKFTTNPDHFSSGSSSLGLNECYLYHGTFVRAALSIAQDNFSLDLAGSHVGTMYGRGGYFCECSSKADEYARDEPDGFYEGVFALLLCRVLMGQPYITEERDEKAGSKFARGEADSTLGDREKKANTYREFVIYDPDQVYPEYCILYERKGKGYECGGATWGALRRANSRLLLEVPSGWRNVHVDPSKTGFSERYRVRRPFARLLEELLTNLGGASYRGIHYIECVEDSTLWLQYLKKRRELEEKFNVHLDSECSPSTTVQWLLSFLKTEAFSAPALVLRRRCPYGTLCYRKNRQHRAEFCHLGDADWEESDGGGERPVSPGSPPTTSKNRLRARMEDEARCLIEDMDRCVQELYLWCLVPRCMAFDDILGTGLSTLFSPLGDHEALRLHDTPGFCLGDMDRTESDIDNLLLCRVLCGKMHKTNNPEADIVLCKSGDQSLVSEGSPRVFFVTDPSQVYPEYAVYAHRATVD